MAHRKSNLFINARNSENNIDTHAQHPKVLITYPLHWVMHQELASKQIKLN